jgi:hypothetical protein
MTGSTKQSIGQQGSKSGLLRLARNDDRNEYTPAISPRISREFCSKVRRLKIRGRRECRTLGASAALRAKVESTQASHHGHAGSPGIPRAMVLTAYFALSPVTGLVCHRRQ